MKRRAMLRRVLPRPRIPCRKTTVRAAFAPLMRSNAKSMLMLLCFLCLLYNQGMKFTTEYLRKFPKVLLHEHLDGGLRPQTIVELARDTGYAHLPTQDVGNLAEWLQTNANRGSLPLYLEGFDHTSGVMQTEEALERVAYETREDKKNDGVVYVETRFAPVLHQSKGLPPEKIVAAVLKGLDRGKKDFGVEYGLILCAMR